MRQQEIYKTKDIFEASWIYSQNIKLIGLEPDGKYFWFIFSDLNTSNKLSQEYWSQQASGNIKSFVNSLKTLKDLVFSKNSAGGLYAH